MSQKKGRRRKKRKQKKILIGVYTGLILLLAVAAGYIWRSNYYKTHFYKDTWINGQDCSYLTASEVKNLLQEKLGAFVLWVVEKAVGRVFFDDFGFVFRHSQVPFLWVLVYPSVWIEP